MSDYMFILMSSNFGYIVFNFLNLNSGWIHRIDNGQIYRPFKAPNFLIGLNVILGYTNLAFLGAGGALFGKSILISGFLWACAIIPVFWYRHYIQDKGVFPSTMEHSLQLQVGATFKKKCGILPYLALILVILDVVFVYNFLK